MSIQLRDVAESDIPVFYQQEQDPVALRMAVVSPKDEALFRRIWRNKLHGDNPSFVKTIVLRDKVVGNVEVWKQEEKWVVGYWIGREFWGQGIATAALREFLTQTNVRPLHAYVAKHNKGSIRVLEKCGFSVIGFGTIFSEIHGHDVEETHFILHS